MCQMATVAAAGCDRRNQRTAVFALLGNRFPRPLERRWFQMCHEMFSIRTRRLHVGWRMLADYVAATQLSAAAPANAPSHGTTSM